MDRPVLPALRDHPDHRDLLMVLRDHPDRLGLTDRLDLMDHPEVMDRPVLPALRAPLALMEDWGHPAHPDRRDRRDHPDKAMRKWFHVIPSALSAAECAELVGYAQTHPAQEATVGHGGGSSVNTSIRTSVVRWLKRADPVLLPLYERISAETHRTNANWFGKDIRSFNDVQFTEYQKDHRYDWHQDCKVPHESRQTPFDRVLSVCIQLSAGNSYEGGELWVNPVLQARPAPPVLLARMAVPVLPVILDNSNQ